MATVMLGEFIDTHREELLRRCREKVAKRSDSIGTDGGAVSEFSEHQRTHTADQSLDQSLHLRNLLYTAITGFEALQTGTLGVSGTTGTLVYKTLMAMRALV